VWLGKFAVPLLWRGALVDKLGRRRDIRFDAAHSVPDPLRCCYDEWHRPSAARHISQIKQVPLCHAGARIRQVRPLLPHTTTTLKPADNPFRVAWQDILYARFNNCSAKIEPPLPASVELFYFQKHNC
jgi:hypothetical protein